MKQIKQITIETIEGNLVCRAFLNDSKDAYLTIIDDDYKIEIEYEE